MSTIEKSHQKSILQTINDDSKINLGVCGPVAETFLLGCPGYNLIHLTILDRLTISLIVCYDGCTCTYNLESCIVFQEN